MSEECTHDCSTCGQTCGERTKESLIAKTNEYSHVKNVYAVVSGKGGVGKSLVTSMLAVQTRKKGYQVAILDADITGPSIPKAFGINGTALANEAGILPMISKTGIKVMSINCLLEDKTDPVVWRGPVIGGTVKQFWTDVVWDEVDYMFVDMPPGTGDVPLTVFQSLPVKGIIIVTSPQDLVSMIVGKAVKMAKLMNIPIVGMIENMSYFECKECKTRYNIFGESHIDELCKEYSIDTSARLPIDPEIAKLCDDGKIEEYGCNALNAVVDKICK